MIVPNLIGFLLFISAVLVGEMSDVEARECACDAISTLRLRHALSEQSRADVESAARYCAYSHSIVAGGFEEMS